MRQLHVPQKVKASLTQWQGIKYIIDHYHLILWLLSSCKNNLIILLPWNKELISPAFSIHVDSLSQQHAFVGVKSSYRSLRTTKAKSWMRNNKTFTNFSQNGQYSSNTFLRCSNF